VRRATALSVPLLILLSAAVGIPTTGANSLSAARHSVATKPTKFRRARPLGAIASKESVTKEMLLQFLLLPHATMANNPLSAAPHLPVC